MVPLASMEKNKMTKLIITNHNVETNEIVKREMNETELAQHQMDIDKFKANQAEQLAKESARQAILTRLGLSAEEAALLLS